MAEMVHVLAGWNDDWDQFYFDTCAPGIADGEPHQHEGDVPAELWARYMGAFDTARDCERQLAELLDVEPGAVRRTACDAYAGEPAGFVLPEAWSVVVPESGSAEEWPVREIPIGLSFDTEAEALEFLAGLPSDLWVVAAHARPHFVESADLIIRHRSAVVDRGDRWSQCQNCGRARGDHAEASGGC